MNGLTLEQKKDYVERIEKKARDENVSFKQASQRLGNKIWHFYKYKAEIAAIERQTARDIKRTDSEAGAVESVSPVRLEISVSETVMKYLETQAESYALEPAIVAQLLLHDCVNGKLKTKPAEPTPGK